MQSEDQYMERTADFVAKVRAMREAAEKEMNRFTRADDYDVRRVVGQGPKASLVSLEIAPPSYTVERSKKSVVKFSTALTSIESVSAPAEQSDHEEGK